MTAGALKVLMIPFLLKFRCVTLERFSSLDMLAICLFAGAFFHADEHVVWLICLMTSPSIRIRRMSLVIPTKRAILAAE